MLSLRQLSRQLPRSVARLTSTAVRQPLRTPAFAAARTAAHFSTSLLRRQGVSCPSAAHLVHCSLCFTRRHHSGTRRQAELGNRPRERAASR
jgi:complement component 1 Q subcomponent-binding protein